MLWAIFRANSRVLKAIFEFYKQGFANLTLGKILWKIIFVKLFVIFFVFEMFVFDDNFKALYKSDEEKTHFVLKNLLQEE
ncbi:DUF4492 domain-containing protein [Campylobacter sp. MIT 12-8780]|uniref:DUF4492 domain-containing protein n=1 Tax=unclassified Campylobacter TaxID=2593542 RepID=UPI0010F58543|nr:MULTISPECIES: DUF4492 domain-containing protein [unclassified Campylobacter]NDJ27390.1 DUF4492 domain-containing protein [Campylobacter sp. MIT 19-121]TKX28514.1 DUF4492 domain-containing protein [Campylobacter sp. MIT 12-5580]TQR40219.1 DUF4492 domain-containing protein [Campylobacter sp. MIT 12-8780]